MQAGFGIVNPSGVGIYKVVIENEIAHFTAGAVTAGTQTWTLARGQEGTTAASHASGVAVVLEVTKGTNDNAVQLSPTAQQTGTINVSGAITSGGLLTGTGLTASHASTHNVGGADVLEDLTRQAAGPAIQGYTAWGCDPGAASTNLTPSAGVVYLSKIMTAHAYTVNNIEFNIVTAGTGVTPLANCFVGIYDSGGTRRNASADQASAWATPGRKVLAVSGGYLVTANDFYYIALLVGTQSTTNVRFGGLNNNLPIFGSGVSLTAATLRFASQLTGQTSLPSPTLTLSSSTSSNVPITFEVN